MQENRTAKKVIFRQLYAITFTYFSALTLYLTLIPFTRKSAFPSQRWALLTASATCRVSWAVGFNDVGSLVQVLDYWSDGPMEYRSDLGSMRARPIRRGDDKHSHFLRSSLTGLGLIKYAHWARPVQVYFTEEGSFIGKGPGQGLVPWVLMGWAILDPTLAHPLWVGWA